MTLQERVDAFKDAPAVAPEADAPMTGDEKSEAEQDQDDEAEARNPDLF